MGQGLNWRVGYWSLAGLALLLPLLAMQVTSAVNWGPGDFLAAAVLLVATGLGFELVTRLLRTPLQRALSMGGVTLAALVIWAELAVGIFR